MTRLCIPITARTYDDMAADVHDACRAGADTIELRLDYLREYNANAIHDAIIKAHHAGAEIIVTCRIASEGGHYDGDESTRIDWLHQAGQDGADFIDCEYEAWCKSPALQQKIGEICSVNKDSNRVHPQLILSKHDFEKTPDDLDTLMTKLRAKSCHIVKMVCRAETITDALRMLDTLREPIQSHPTIALSMGEAGAMTRILAKKFDAFLTFASLTADKQSAPGQPTFADMRKIYRYDAIRQDSRTYGVIGCPVAHSMSPAILNASFDAINYNGVYLPMRVEPGYEALAAFLDGCISRPWFGLHGCSVTIPHKHNLLRYAQTHGGHIEPLAQRIGAANTLCIVPGKRDDGSDAKVSVYNTDYRGALDALCDGMGCSPEELGERTVAVLGAGGASRAVVAGLRDYGCNTTIYNRTEEKAQALAQEFGAKALPWDTRLRTTADVIVQCTSIGMWPNVDDAPLPSSSLSQRQVVFDTIYNPIETQLLREARDKGCRTIDGVEMFVRQAAAQFEHWTRQAAPTDLMREVVIANL